MGPNREQRLPTAWVEPFARVHGARVDSGWDVNSFRAAFRGSHGHLPWELVVDGHLDTDYPATSALKCSTPYAGSFEVLGGPSRAMTSGTEADLVFMAVSAARSWWRRRGRDAGQGAAGDAGAGSSATPTPGASLNVTDSEGMLTPQILAMLEDWPPSSHARSARHDDRFQLRLSYGGLILMTENLWGEAVAAHQLRVCYAILDALASRPG